MVRSKKMLKNTVLPSKSNFTFGNFLLGFFTAIVLIIGIFFITAGEYGIAAVTFLVPFILYAALSFDKYSDYYLLGSMFLLFYFSWALRVLPTTIVLFFCFFLLLIKKDSSDYFNKYKLPVNFKLVTIALTISVFISAFLTPHFSGQSVYFAFLFVIYLSTFYFFFRTVKDSKKIESYLKFFLIILTAASFISLLQILVTGNLRSVGLTGYAIMDFAAMGLLIVLIRFFILEKTGLLYKICTVIIIIILITTQSRFAWLGFLLAFIYGLIICYRLGGPAKAFIKKRIPLVLFLFLLLMAGIFATGLNTIIMSRVLNINFNLFGTEQGEFMIQNSLETRVLIWVVAYNTFIQNPFFGIGYLMFSEMSENYNVLPDIIYDAIVKGLDAHTTFLNFLVETGLIGLLLFILFLIIVYYYSYKAIKMSTTIMDRNNSIILNVLIFFVFVHSIYSGAFTFGLNAYFLYFLIGITIGNYVYIKNKNQTIPQNVN